MAGPSRVRRKSWRWAAARSIGTSHQKNGLPCQDYYACHQYRGVQPALIAVVSDGAGSASRSQVGAFLTCREFVKKARQLVLRNRRLPTEREAEDLVQSIRSSIQSVAAKAGVPTREFAATLVGVVATPNEAVVVHVGDGAVIWQQADGWKTASWPAHGEYASTTYFVTDDELQVRVSAAEAPVNSLALFSDGLERLVLDFAKGEPHAPFFDRMIDPVRKASQAGRNPELSLQLKSFLTQDRVNARTDDDKTLVLVAR